MNLEKIFKNFIIADLIVFVLLFVNAIFYQSEEVSAISDQLSFGIFDSETGVLLGFGFAAFATMQTTLLIRVSSPEMRGRVLGALSFCIGLGPLTAVQIGPLVNYIGFQYGLFVVLLEGAILLAATAYFFPTIIQKLTAELIRQHGHSVKN